MTAASNWIIPVVLRPGVSSKERLSPETTPADSEPSRPRGLPTTNIWSPTWGLSPSTSGAITVGSRLGVGTAMSSPVSPASTDALARLPSAKETLIEDALDDVKRREDSPRLSTMTPVPSSSCSAWCGMSTRL